MQHSRILGFYDSPKTTEELVFLCRDIEDDLISRVLSKGAKGRIFKLLDDTKAGFANLGSSAEHTVSVE
jgi:hypothetical protein